MTRAERLAAGWKPCFGIYDPGDAIQAWVRESSYSPSEPLWAGGRRRFDFGSREAAQTRIDRYYALSSYGDRLVVRRFWRRKRSGAA